MDSDEIDDVARLAPPGGRHDFVRGEIDRMEYVAEFIVFLCREEAEIAVDRPLQPGGFVVTGHEHLVDPGLASLPRGVQAGVFQQGRIFCGSARHALFAVVENVDVVVDPLRAR